MDLDRKARNNKKYYWGFAVGIVIILLFGVFAVNAGDFFYLRGIDYPLNNNFTLESPDGAVGLTVFATSTPVTLPSEGLTGQESMLVKMMALAPQKTIKNYFTPPSGVDPASDLYFIKFSKEQDFTKMPEVTVHYGADNHFKEVYYYSWMDLRFEKLESRRDSLNRTLTFQMPSNKKVLFAVFNEPELVGAASWYVYPKYRGELITASRDFAKGTQLKVTNLYNEREVIVTVCDYGPKLCVNWTDKEQRLMGPCKERVLDLSKTAFLELATSTGQGIISQIKVEPYGELQIAND